MQDFLAKVKEQIWQKGNLVIQFAGSMILIILCWYSIRYTQYMEPFQLEFPINRTDSVIRNILIFLVVLVIIGGLSILEKKCSLRTQKVIRI